MIMFVIFKHTDGVLLFLHPLHSYTASQSLSPVQKLLSKRNMDAVSFNASTTLAFLHLCVIVRILHKHQCFTMCPLTSGLQEVVLNIFADIILGTYKEGGAVTFWSHTVSLPLSSNAILSWKFCNMVHKLLRDGHPNVSPVCDTTSS